MKTALQKKWGFLLRGYTRRIDPRARAGGAFDLLQASLSDPDKVRRPKSEELRAAWDAVQTLRRIVLGLRKSPFWGALEGPRVSERVIMLREQPHVGSRKWLFSERVTLADVVRVMDAQSDAVQTMNTIFQVARVDPLDQPEDMEKLDRDWTLDRFKCATLLPYLDRQMRYVWVPIRKTIRGTRKNKNPRVTDQG
jgi:hypothetical protein